MRHFGTREQQISRPPIKISFLKPSAGAIDAARELIDRVHYQDGKIDGEFIIAFADLDDIKTIEPDFVPIWKSDNLCIVGVAVVKSGMTHGNPKGRRDLAEKKVSRY